MSETILGRSHHDQFGSNSLSFVVKNYVARVVPRALFGERSLGGAGADYTGDHAIPLHVTNATAHDALIVCAWLVVLIIVVLAVIRFTDPNWTLAIVAAVFSVGFFGEEMLINTSVVQPRYIIAPTMLLYTALVALMRPKLPEGAKQPEAAERPEGATGSVTALRWLPSVDTAVRWLPAVGFTVLLLVAVTLNFRVTNGRTTSPAWSSVVATAQKDCTRPHVTAYTFVHEWWYVTIPCSKVG